MISTALNVDLAKFSSTGLHLLNDVHYQESPERIVQQVLSLQMGLLADTGALVIETGKFTGRSPKDKFIVFDDITRDAIDWNNFNQPLEAKYFNLISKRIRDFLDMQADLWIRDCYACADPSFRLNIRVITNRPWMDLFAYNMFIQPEKHELKSFHPNWQILCAPDLTLQPDECGIANSNAVVISFSQKTILIAGTGYTGELKKSIFTVLNFLMPMEKNVLPMHCSANVGADNDMALFFGLSGTGKTTLSADTKRRLIGDDEHGWSHTGIFNFEGGCYAKCIGLSQDKEPEIFKAVKNGALVENTRFKEGSRMIDFDDCSITENIRVSYPISYISNAANYSVGGIPKNIFFLTCDAYGVLPPISRLTIDQALYHFLSGYTAKVAGTETGIKEPVSTFSACFGAPFLPLHPEKYAQMLGEKLNMHHVKVWMINTGWTGGPYGVGKRIDLTYTRAMISAVLNGSLDHISFTSHPVFGMQVPASCAGVPAEILDVCSTWADRDAYHAMAKQLAGQFLSNFGKYKESVGENINQAAPVI